MIKTQSSNIKANPYAASTHENDRKRSISPRRFVSSHTNTQKGIRLCRYRRCQG